MIEIRVNRMVLEMWVKNYLEQRFEQTKYVKYKVCQQALCLSFWPVKQKRQKNQKHIQSRYNPFKKFALCQLPSLNSTIPAVVYNKFGGNTTKKLTPIFLRLLLHT